MELTEQNAQTIVAIGYYLFVVLNGLDYWLTNKVLAAGGKEFNPAVKWALKRGGKLGFILLKLFVLLWLATMFAFGVLDIFTIWWLNVIFIVVLSMMAIDGKKKGIFSGQS